MLLSPVGRDVDGLISEFFQDGIGMFKEEKMFLSLCRSFLFDFNVFELELSLMATFITSLKRTLSFLSISAVFF